MYEIAANAQKLHGTYRWYAVSIERVKRQPDKILYEDKYEEDVTPMNKVSDDEDFFSAEAEETMPIPTFDERTQKDQDIQAEQIGAASKTTTKTWIFLLLFYLMVIKPQLNHRCLNHCVNHPYTPGTVPNPNLQPRRRVNRKRRKMTVNLITSLWTLRLTPRKMKVEYYWALLRRKVEVSGYTALVQ